MPGRSTARRYCRAILWLHVGPSAGYRDVVARQGNMRNQLVALCHDCLEPLFMID